MDSGEIAKFIGEKIRSLRSELGLTQAEVAKKAGLNPNAYSKVERGEQLPAIPTLLKIAEALDVKSSDILPR